MPSRAEERVARLVLAAGGSRRLGRLRRLLPYGSAALLDHTLAAAPRVLASGLSATIRA